MIKHDNYMNRLSNIIDNGIDIISKNPYITGMGLGYKTINNKTIDIPTITFVVQKKLSPSEIHPNHLVPQYVNGVITDVYEGGDFTLSANEKRPAYAGISVANSSNKTLHGTIAYAVTEKSTKKDIYILSCAHVLSSFMETGQNFPSVIQPAIAFGGVPTKPPRPDDPFPRKSISYIGALFDSTELKWAKDKSELKQDIAITMDAAIARVGPNIPDTRDTILGQYFLVGGNKKKTYITNTTIVNGQQKIWTITSNSTGQKHANLQLTDVLQSASFGEGNNKKLVFYKDQYIVKRDPKSFPFELGDSGALGIVEAPGNPAFGMLVASTPDSAIFTPIDRILERFKVTFVSPDPTPSQAYYR